MNCWGDIKIKCNHYPNPDEAIVKWMKRREKINYSNLIFEMYTESKEVIEKFDGPILNGRKWCFAPFETTFSSSIYLPMQQGQNAFC